MHTLQNNTLVLLSEPLDGVFLAHLLSSADSAVSGLSSGHSGTGSGEDDVEVHTEDTSGRVVLDAKIDVLRDTEAEVAGVGEVGGEQLVFLHLQASLEDLGSLLASDSAVASDLFVSSDTEGTEGVSG